MSIGQRLVLAFTNPFILLCIWVICQMYLSIFFFIYLNSIFSVSLVFCIFSVDYLLLLWFVDSLETLLISATSIIWECRSTYEKFEIYTEKVSPLGHWTPTETASECIQLPIASTLSLSDISTFVKKPALLTNSSPVLL